MKNSIKEQLRGKRILFATVPGDGHFNPLTGLAKYLQESGCDVRWYTSNIFSDKLQKLGIPLYPFDKVLDINAENKDELFPEGKGIIDPLQKMNFELIHFFIERSVEYYEDIRQIYQDFPFHIMIADSLFSAIPFVKAKLNIPVISIGIIPLPVDSIDLAPYGMALPPAKNETERIEYAKLRDLSVNIYFKDAVDVFEGILKEHGIPHQRAILFNLLIEQSDIYLQIGTPSFEYPRNDKGKNIHFIGGLLPYSFNNSKPLLDERLKQYESILLVTQGTVERNTQKILEPTLEAFQNTDTLVIATTGGHGTKELKEKYTSQNLIIEDNIPFADIMPYAHVYVTNGGYSGTLLSIKHKLPMIAAGLHEGKNEVCARIGYFNYGINLNTETPTPKSISEAVEEIRLNPVYKNNVTKLSEEMSSYHSYELCAQYVTELSTFN